MDITKQSEIKMHKSVDKLKQDLVKIRTGRAHPGILDHVLIDYYGTMVPISQVATVVVQDARTLSVQPYESKMASVIEKEIRNSDLGLNPQVNGAIVRVPMPPLTEERRKDLIKVIKAEAEEAKVAVRNVRRDANNELKNLLKDKEITEDVERKVQDEVQRLTDKHVQEIDRLVLEKEKELMTV